MTETIHILVVDRDPEWREFIYQVLAEDGYTVHLESDVNSARQAVSGNDFDLIIVDALLLKLLKTLAMEPVRHRLLVVTTAPSVPEAITAYRWGALDYVNKAFGKVGLLRTVATVLKKQPAQQPSLV